MTQPCYSTGDGLYAAMKKCPFLHNIAQTHGPEYATSLAFKPACPNATANAHRPLLAEDYDGCGFSSTFALFHGRGGILPLPHLPVSEPKVLYPIEQSFAQAESERPHRPFSSGTLTSNACCFVPPLMAAAPLASMSMSWGSSWFNIHHLFQKHIGNHRAQQRKPPQQLQQPNDNLHGGVAGPGLGGPGPSSAHSTGTGGGGKCPLRRALGPLAGVVFNKHGQLSCPEPIVKMRAALAATRPVRELRPQALPVKLLAVAMTTAALNVPCGIWREHTEKFSSQWFVAVHATIPFIAMLRKAVVMPKYAILFTICAAIAGQAMGARLERKRLMAQARNELGGLAKASPAVAPCRPATAAAGRQQTALPVASLLMSVQSLDRPAVANVTQGSASWMFEHGGGEGFCNTEAEVRPYVCGVKAGYTCLRAVESEQQEQQRRQLQFRVSKVRSGRAAGTKMSVAAAASGGGARLLVGRVALAPAAIAAMVSEVTC